jgi:hypothetical protein
MYRRHDLASFIIWAAATVALVQTASSAEGPASTGAQSAVATHDFSGIWTKPYLGWEPPLSGPRPVTNKVRRETHF